MSAKGSVSIIIPAYNAADYVKEAVDSALAQTYKEMEVVVVDDGSTDETKKILEPYVKKNEIKYVYEQNKGLAGARNTGIKNSSGEYIAFLDADDLFLPEKAAEQVRVLEENPSYGVCYSDLLHFSEAGRVFHHRYDYPSGNLFEPLLHRQFLNPLTVMVRKEIFDRYGFFDETLRRSEDWDLWLRWARAGVRFYFLDKPLARYRVRTAGNLSDVASEPEMKEKNLFIFERIGRELSPEERNRYGFPGIIKTLKAKLVFAYLMTGDKKNALKEAKKFSFPLRLLVSLLPGSWWKFGLRELRRIKHRFLLKKVV